MTIKAIIFDCFGVLVVPGRYSLQYDFPDLANELHDLTMRSDYGYISRQEFNQSAAELTGLSVEEFQTRYWEANVRNEPAFNWANELKKTGNYKIGMLSNIGIGWLNDFISETEREQLFDSVVLSGEAGVTKPSVESFELIAQHLGAEPYECVMIDDLLVNIDGAQRAGMKTILFGTTRQAQIDFAYHLESQDA